MADFGFLNKKPGFATVAIHATHEPGRSDTGAVVAPLSFATTYRQPSANDPSLVYKYGRTSNPSRFVLQECLAALDGGRHALVYSSGLGAVTTILGLLKSGDHIVSCDDLYSGTSRLFRTVATNMGISTSFVDLTDVSKIKNAIQHNTKMINLETPTNPLLKVYDIAAIVKVVREIDSKNEIIIVLDNTFLTPYFQRPLALGVDIVMYSLSKYMNGHSDVIMGAAIVERNDLGEKLAYLQKAMGAVPSPFDCYMVNRSLKTLAVRMEHHKKSSLLIAQWLQKHPNITEVLHPGLPTHPQYEIAQKQTSGHSGVFSFRHSGGLKESMEFLDALKIFILAESLGGFESLAQLPSTMTHISVPAEQRAKLGITDSLIRLSIGLEDPEDLIQDLSQALDVGFSN